MARFVGTWFHILLLVLLFLGSVFVLVSNTLTTLTLPQQELESRKDLQSASRKMAEAAREIAGSLVGNLNPDRDRVNEKLRLISSQVLAEYPGVEGGFFVALDDRFSGYSYPTNKHAPSEVTRTEPPPLEASLIRRQAQQSLDSGHFILRTEDVASSRVVIATEPVGEPWPATLTTWLMVRLTGPELLSAQLQRFKLSSFLALGGMGLALLLTWSFARTLKQQRREQERLRDELRHAEHLAGLGKLLAGVAHEVRNPLAAIRSTVQLWERLPDQSLTAESIHAVVLGVDRLAAIVSRLLLFARADNAERRSLDINQLLKETLELITAQAEAQGVLIARPLNDSLPLVLGSANALRQVFLNLFTNALQAMPNGGRLECTTLFRGEHQEVVIEISDTGKGVSEEDRLHLFEPFFTTRPDGTGLGLALCREIVVNHRGTIDYLAHKPYGATFRIGLPAF